MLFIRRGLEIDWERIACRRFPGTSHFEKTLCTARQGSAISSRRSYSSRASPGTLLVLRMNSPLRIGPTPLTQNKNCCADPMGGNSHFLEITSLRSAPLGAANLFAVLGLPGLRQALFWFCE